MLTVELLNKAEVTLKVLGALVSLLGAIIGIYLKLKGNRPEKSLADFIRKSNLPSEQKKEIAGALSMQRHLSVALIALVSVLAIGSILLIVFSSTPRDALARYLEKRDPAVFYRASTYGVARSFANPEQLVSTTDFSGDLGRVKKSFDFVVNTGSIVFTHLTMFRDALKRGVDIRIVLSHPGETNATNLDNFQVAIKQSPAQARAQILDVLQMLSKLRAEATDQTTYKGSLQVRLNTNPLLYTMWVADRNSPEAVGHIGVHFYNGKQTWPSFRFSKDSMLLVDNAAQEFGELWSRSVPAENLVVK